MSMLGGIAAFAAQFPPGSKVPVPRKVWLTAAQQLLRTFVVQQLQGGTVQGIANGLEVQSFALVGRYVVPA